MPTRAGITDTNYTRGITGCAKKEIYIRVAFMWLLETECHIIKYLLAWNFRYLLEYLAIALSYRQIKYVPVGILQTFYKKQGGRTVEYVSTMGRNIFTPLLVIPVCSLK